MRILFWNLGYCRGIDGSIGSYVTHLRNFVRHDVQQQKAVLDQMGKLVMEVRPDIFTYAEVLTGSGRNHNFNQHEYLVGQIGETHHTHSAVTKYGNTIFSSLPFHKGNYNGVISFVEAMITNHLLRHSRKKLVQEIQTKEVTIFVVHLPLISKDRKNQFEELSQIVNKTEGNVVVCGDFNILDGFDELNFLKTHTNLVVAGDGESTFPSYKPKIQLDVFMYRFEDVSVRPEFIVLKSAVSDHLPVLLEW